METVIAGAGLAFVVLSGVIGVVWRLSAKIYQVEIWARDEFVRKVSFEAAIGRMEKSMENMASKIENAVDKMATRMENIGHNDR
jgi:hypothetical protein